MLPKINVVSTPTSETLTVVATNDFRFSLAEHLRKFRTVARIYMNHKSMVLIALLLPVFCCSQNSEEHVAALEEHVASLETKINKHMLEIVSLVKQSNATIRKTIETMHTNFVEQHLYRFLVWTLTHVVAHHALIFSGLKCNRGFPDSQFFITTIIYYMYIA